MEIRFYIVKVAILMLTMPFFCAFADENGLSNSDDLYLSGKIANAIQHNNYDSLGYWNEAWKKVSLNEAQQRFELLYNIYTNQFEPISSQNIIENLIVYRAVENGFINNDTVNHLPYRSKDSYPLLAENYNDATKEFAKQLSAKKGDDIETNLLLVYYSGNYDSIFHLIQQSLPKSSFLHKQYTDYIAQTIHQSHCIRLGLSIGNWYPNGELAILGEHPYAGIQMGVENYYGWGFYLTMEQRFGNLPDSLPFLFDSELHYTNRYIGGYYGLNISKDLFSKINHKIAVIAGIALDGFNTTFDLVEQNKYLETNIYSLNLNLGITYKYMMFQTLYTEVKAMYHMVNYNSETDLDLSGNVFTIGLGIGINSGRNERMNIMKHLDFKF